MQAVGPHAPRAWAVGGSGVAAGEALEAAPPFISGLAFVSNGVEELDREFQQSLLLAGGEFDGRVGCRERVVVDESRAREVLFGGSRLEAIEETTDQDDVRRQAQAATTEVDRLTRRIEQVLALARSDAGAGLVEIADATAVARERVGAARPNASRRDLHIDERIAPGLTVSCSVGTLARVIDELLGNALSYASTQVRVTLEGRGGAVALRVEDDGPGIAASEWASVFDRFTRGSSAVPGGSGLGLALVREAARAIGGDAVAGASDLGGLTVEVTWPAPK